MGIFDFLKEIFSSQEGSEELVKERWIAFDDGTYRDMLQDYDEMAWRVGVSWFELWFQGLEKRTEQSLGRRLAHAAVEHEEYMLSLIHI